MTPAFNSFCISRVLLKYKWHLIILLVITTVLGLIISSPLIIKPKFKSYAILYPVNLKIYSEESLSEQMMAWLNARCIMDSIISKYDLASHYRIDTTNPGSTSAIQKTYDKNVRFKKTRFETVVIEVFDTDPVLAKDMTNSIIDFYNQTVNNSYREKYKEVLKLEERRLLKKQQQLDSLQRKIVKIRETYKLIDYGIQAGEVTRGLLGTFDGGNISQVNKDEVNALKENLQSKGDSLLLLTNLISAVVNSYTNLQISFETAQQNVEKNLTFATVLTYPVVADKKSFPVRIYIAALTVLPAVLLFLGLIFFFENKDFFWKEE